MGLHKGGGGGVREEGERFCPKGTVESKKCS